MPPLAAVPDLEQELDGLYALPLGEFTRARDDLARRLKRAHQADAAAEVKALRKPSLAAWAANALARAEPEPLRRLLAAAETLRDAQLAALAGRGEPSAVRAAAEAEREALHPVVAAVERLLGNKATPALLERVVQTVRAAALDDEARPLLARGRLVQDVRPSGFAPLDGAEIAAPAGADRARKRQERLRELRAEARRLMRAAEEAERAADRAEEEARRLRTDAAELRDAAEHAAGELASAEQD